MNYTAVIILQYGRGEMTVECVQSFLRHNSAPVKLIVVDNASPREADRKLVREYLHRTFAGNVLEIDGSYSPAPGEQLPAATFVTQNVNEGYARGNNIGVRLAAADPTVDALLISNPDIIYTEDIVTRLHQVAVATPSGALFGPVLREPGTEAVDVNTARHPVGIGDLIRINGKLFATPRSIRRRTTISVTQGSGLVPAELISGGCFFALKSVFLEIGAFDPGTFLFYEENILWEKIRRRGMMNYLVTDLSVIHIGHGTLQQRPPMQIVRAGLKSQRHFVRTYLRPGPGMRFLYNLSGLWVLGVLTTRNLFRRNGNH